MSKYFDTYSLGLGMTESLRHKSSNMFTIVHAREHVHVHAHTHARN